MSDAAEVLASLVPHVPFRADTPLGSLLPDREHWLAFAHALADHGFVMTDADAGRWVTVADMLESVNAARSGYSATEGGGDHERS